MYAARISPISFVDLLLEIVHHIANKAETRMQQQLIEELRGN
jgi:hypothetical protein